MKKNHLIQSILFSSIVLSGSNALAQTIGTAEGLEPITSTTAIPGQTVNAATITAILSQPGSFGGHTYTGWSFLINDGTGSADVFTTATALSSVAPGYTPTVGDSISLAGSYSPFHQIPEFATLTAFSLISSGNPAPAPSVFNVSQLNQTTLPLNIAGQLVELDNVTIGGTGGVGGLFPTFAQDSVANETFTVTDGTGSMTLFDWVSSYSAAAALAGTPVPTGPVDIIGFDSAFTSGGTTTPEFTPIAIVATPEPTTLGLLGAGSILAVFFRSRKNA